ncbi:hypothetical protein niasHT_008231 [Heterodera trifolii]|uniref:Uncharacterized protein n=1 Tax=Heterodera trifolii TaxID=157864 RepID=A0ABD2LX89_9BILA
MSNIREKREFSTAKIQTHQIRTLGCSFNSPIKKWDTTGKGSGGGVICALVAKNEADKTSTAAAERSRGGNHRRPGPVDDRGQMSKHKVYDEGLDLWGWDGRMVARQNDGLWGGDGGNRSGRGRIDGEGNGGGEKGVIFEGSQLSKKGVVMEQPKLVKGY